jgi:hypothetical protein
MPKKSKTASSFSLMNNYVKIKQRGHGERHNVREGWLQCTRVCLPDFTVSLKHDGNRILLTAFCQTARAVSKAILTN